MTEGTSLVLWLDSHDNLKVEILGVETRTAERRRKKELIKQRNDKWHVKEVRRTLLSPHISPMCSTEDLHEHEQRLHLVLWAGIKMIGALREMPQPAAVDGVRRMMDDLTSFCQEWGHRGCPQTHTMSAGTILNSLVPVENGTQLCPSPEVSVRGLEKHTQIKKDHLAAEASSYGTGFLPEYWGDEDVLQHPTCQISEW